MSVARRAAVLAVAAVGAPAAPAAAQDGTGTTQPAYPGNTVTAAPVDPPLIAQSLRTVRLTGRAQYGTDFDIGMTASLFVQDARVDGACAPTFDQQRQKQINVPGVNATAGGSGFVLQEARVVPPPSPGVLTVDWSADTQPFVVRRGISRVLLCAYTRYSVDEVAAYGVAAEVRQPACRAPGSVRRGRALRLSCTVLGKGTVRFTRGGRRVERPVTLRESGGRGVGRVSTRGLRAGRHRVQLRAGGEAVGRPVTVRVT